MEDAKVKSGKSIMIRDANGKFIKGNTEGNRVPKGYAGKPRGARNKKNVIARQFAEDVLFLDPETGKKMTYHQLCCYISRKADKSPRILNLLLDHYLGKPVEQVQHQVVPIIQIINAPEPTDPVEDAEVVEEEQFQLPEPE